MGLIDHFRAEAVAVFKPVRHRVSHVIAAQRTQAEHAQRGTGCAVGIEIAHHDNPRAFPERVVEHFSRLFDATQRLPGSMPLTLRSRSLAVRTPRLAYSRFSSSGSVSGKSAVSPASRRRSFIGAFTRIIYHPSVSGARRGTLSSLLALVARHHIAVTQHNGWRTAHAKLYAQRVMVSDVDIAGRGLHAFAVHRVIKGLVAVFRTRSLSYPAQAGSARQRVESR